MVKSARRLAANNSVFWHRQLSIMHSWGLASVHKHVQYNKFGVIFSGNYGIPTRSRERHTAAHS